MNEKEIEKSRILCLIIFIVYAVLTFIGAANHELWFDEAQAWTLVRDNDIGGIFRQLSYEGHPPLWYLILYVPSHLGLPCTVMPYISWFITALAGAIIMFKAPFHIVTRTAVLFSGGFLFVNSVISRTYCIINLIIVLIALIYPKRKEHPVLYGLLIALLANTHIFICGFIGIMGIFMIIDLFKDFRSKSVKQKSEELIGLGIAGLGVLTMVIPLLNSLSLNSVTGHNIIKINDVISSFLESFMNASVSIINYAYYTGEYIDPVSYILAGFISAAFIAMIVIMRHKTRPFLMLIFYWFFYTVTTEVFWATIPNRALIFALIYFVILWIAEYEPQNSAVGIWDKLDHKIDTAAIKKIIESVKSFDKGFRKSYTVMITAVMLASVPFGAYYLFSDYTKDFSPSEKAAEHIRNNFPENCVLITDGDGASYLTAYLPGYKFYSLYHGEYYTYTSHKTVAAEAEYAHIYNDLKNCRHIYYIFESSDIEYISSNSKAVCIIREGMPYGTSFGINIRYIEISVFDADTDLMDNYDI